MTSPFAVLVPPCWPATTRQKNKRKRKCGRTFTPARLVPSPCRRWPVGCVEGEGTRLLSPLGGPSRQKCVGDNLKKNAGAPFAPAALNPVSR